MWENDKDSYRRKHAGENMHNARTDQRERDVNSKLNRETSQQYGNTNNYTATNTHYTATRNTPQLPTTDSRNMHQNNSSMPPFSGMMLTGASMSMPPSQPLFNMSPGYSNTRMPFNVPPPGFNTTNVPPPGFNTNIPPPGYINQRMPPSEYVNNVVPSPGIGPHNVAPRPGIGPHNVAPRPGIGPPPCDNRLFGSMLPHDGTLPVGVLPPDRGVRRTSSMDINKYQHSNVSLPPVLSNQGLSSLHTFPVNQIHIANQQGGLPQNSIVVSANQQTETRMEDQTWVNTFIKERKFAPNEETQIPKVSEAKQMLEKWFQLINEMEAQHDKLSERIKSGDSEWQREMQKTNILKEEMLQIESEFPSKYDMDSLQKEINKKKKKREWKKRQKRNLALKKKEMEKRNFELHLQIDQWREKEIAKDQAKFKAASMKKEAGGVLGDVRRKQADSSKALSLLEALKKLRSFRKQEAELKGVYPKPSADQTKEFNSRIEIVERIMKKHHELYESEEKTLVVMLAEEEEEKEKIRRRKMHTKQLAQAAASDSSDPMREFYRYYTQAENGLDSLLHIRHGWDVYVVPQTVPGASFVPPQNVTPIVPSSKAWDVFLKDKE